MKKCKCEWCEELIQRAEYCKRHASQIRNWGECRFSRGDKNQYILYEDYAEIILYDKDLKEKSKAIIDLEDVEKCKPYKWTLRNDGYVSTKKNYQAIKLHRFIADTPEGMHTDHINRNRLDNRKDNLKICNQKENNKNKGLYKSNQLGYTGVSKARTLKEGFISCIRFENKTYHLGSFDTFEEAVKARQDAEVKFYGKILEL